jgi:hypothetical protein
MKLELKYGNNHINDENYGTLCNLPTMNNYSIMFRVWHFVDAGVICD